MMAVVGSYGDTTTDQGARPSAPARRMEPPIPPLPAGTTALDRAIAEREIAERRLATCKSDLEVAVHRMLSEKTDADRRAAKEAKEAVEMAELTLDARRQAEDSARSAHSPKEREALLSRFADLGGQITVGFIVSEMKAEIASIVEVQALLAERAAALSAREDKVAAGHAARTAELQQIATTLGIKLDASTKVGKDALRLLPRSAAGIALRAALREACETNGYPLTLQLVLRVGPLPKDGSSVYPTGGPSPYSPT